MDHCAIGVDIEHIDRFRGLTREKDGAFLNKVFNAEELDYCFSKKQSGPHLAVRFCAKEAIVKALHSLGVRSISYTMIEVSNFENGVPNARIRSNPCHIKVSMSHCADHAVAFVLVTRKNT